MLSTRTIACCLAAATMLTALTSCRQQVEFFQPDATCVHNGKPVTGPALLLTNGLTPVNYDTAVCGFMPMHKDAYWVYTDSLFDSNGALTSVKLDTLSVKNIYRSPGGPSLFWQFRSRNNNKGMDGKLLYTTDSMLYAISGATVYPSFYTEFTWAGYPAAGYPQERPVSMAPPVGDTMFTGNFYIDLAYFEKIVKHTSIITVPAGSYSGCLGFTKTYGYGYSPAEMVFKPGVGLVEYKTYYPGNSYNMYINGPKKQVSVLTSYHLF